MNSQSTSDLFDQEQTLTVPATSLWTDSPEHQRQSVFGFVQMAKTVGLFVSLAISPMTAINDPWFIERRRRDSAITVLMYHEIIGRFISRSEALRIASHILQQAEQERLSAAEFEAARGIQWEEQQ